MDQTYAKSTNLGPWNSGAASGRYGTEKQLSNELMEKAVW